MKNRVKKSLAIFLIVLVISMTISFAFSFNSREATAERFGCCARTINGEYCQDGGGVGISENLCEPGEFYNAPCATNTDKCRLITCALNTSCMEQVPRYTCLYKFKGTPAIGGECQKGCCGIANRPIYAENPIVTRKTCNLTAYARGYNDSYVQFLPEITNERNCINHFDQFLEGCCITSSGCRWKKSAECDGEFFPNVLCKNIRERCQAGEWRLKCIGDDVYYTNNLGDEKLDRTCTTPKYMCMECLNETCTDKQWNLTAHQFEGYCEDTTCYLDPNNNLTLEHQKIDEKGKVTPDILDAGKKTLVNGFSICYNFYKSADKTKEGENSTEIMLGRSTGLQNHKLVCNYGKVEIVGLGIDRKQLCVEDDSNFTARTFINEWEKCMKCGESSNKVLNTIGDLVAPGWVIASWLGEQVGEQCHAEECVNITATNGEKLCFYDRDGWDVAGSTPPGSCVPRFPPGTNDTCKECGGGGDELWNICKREEAYALGNCQFKPHGPLPQFGLFLISAIGFFADNRLGLFPVEALFLAVDECGGWDKWACIPGKWAPNLLSVPVGIIVGPIKLALDGIGAIAGIVKLILTSVFGQLQNTIINTIFK
ncbi:MAG: hypothetical protein QXP53_02670 [Candidatus Pacearchaeota archaeon]